MDISQAFSAIARTPNSIEFYKYHGPLLLFIDLKQAHKTNTCKISQYKADYKAYTHKKSPFLFFFWKNRLWQ